VNNGVEQKVGAAWVKKNFLKPGQDKFHWLLAQQTLAAAGASSFQYDSSGGTGQPMRPLRRLIALLRPEAGDVKTIFVFSLVVGLLSLTTPLAVEAVVNTIAFGRYLQPLVILSLIVLIFLGFRAFLQILMTVIAEFIQRKLFVRTVEDLSYRLTRVPLPTWRKYHGPELVNRFFDIVNVQKITAKLFLDTLMLVLQTLIGLSVLAFYHPFLLGYDIGLLALMTVVLYSIGRGAIKTAKDESQLKYETAAWLQEIVRHPSTFKFNGGMGFAINRADELTASYINHRQTHFEILLRQISFSMVMQVIAATTLLALGGYLVIIKQLTLGQLVAAELIVTVILGSFAKIGKDLESFYDLMASVDKLGKLFDLPVEAMDQLVLPRSKQACGLTLAGLKLDADAKGPCNIEIEPGTSLAVHGSSELRRSRLIEVLVGQTKAAEGYVLIDDYRIDTVSAESLQESVSLIREIEIFEGTVDENIRMGREGLGSDRVNHVIEQLGLGSFVTGLDDGLKTKLSISGYPLSQGEAIRLVLARTLIARPNVLFVDGLIDRLSDSATLDVLKRLKSFEGQTTIVISTGRRVIADWAGRNLDISTPSWELSKRND
jgi:putative ABC transport system ATP-binding protein